MTTVPPEMLKAVFDTERVAEKAHTLWIRAWRTPGEKEALRVNLAAGDNLFRAWWAVFELFPHGAAGAAEFHALIFGERIRYFERMFEDGAFAHVMNVPMPDFPATEGERHRHGCVNCKPT